MNEGGVVTVMEAISAAITTVTTAVTKDLTVGNIGTLIATGLTFSLPFFVFWFGYRFLIGKATRAFRKGKL